MSTDPLTYEKISGLISRQESVILEIGANNGSASLGLYRSVLGAKIYCFEPDPRAIQKWLKRKFPDSVQLSQVAIGSVNGRATFYMSDGLEEKHPEGWDKSGSIRPPKRHLERHPAIKFNRTIDVDVMTLDSWANANNIDIVDFIWADTQGAEVDLIQGGREVLARTRYFYTEYRDNELYEGQRPLRELMKMLPEFEILSRYPGDVLFRNRAFPA
ncbi:FkbM family methyltransferase [Chelatococcus sambhunathii]|uniref:FkbM family methyltransferase n=1 Tax=Chelatococcus sambhunathii TaxID=363953 RepID=UPI002852C8C2|nr:FkbM family methyltransferase [Chelatococcus sambhunathii]